jgi:hypothetical protein
MEEAIASAQELEHLAVYSPRTVMEVVQANTSEQQERESRDYDPIRVLRFNLCQPR